MRTSLLSSARNMIKALGYVQRYENSYQHRCLAAYAQTIATLVNLFLIDRVVS